SAGRLFSTSCSSTCRSTCKLRDLKSPAQISDLSLFCDCPVSNVTVCEFSFSEEPGTEGVYSPLMLPESRLVSPGATTFDIFLKGGPPVGTVLGESCETGRRIGRSAVFDIVN